MNEDKLYGTVFKITYFNEGNGYGIVRIKLNYSDNIIAKFRSKLFTNLLTVTCNFDRKPLIDEEYDFVGEFISTQYGTQFKAKSFSRRGEDTLEGVVVYLSSELFPGIGKAIATKVYNTLGKNCLDLIENDQSVLDQVDIKDNQKETIYNSIVANAVKKRIIVGLLSYGITMQTCLKLLSVLGDEALDIIKKNPYQLMDLVEGFGFLRADRIALNSGVKKDASIRLQALLIYMINGNTYSRGDTYIEYNSLFDKVSNELNKEEEIIDSTNFLNTIKELEKAKKIFVDEEKNIYDYFIYNSENLVAERIVNLLNNDFDYGYNNKDINEKFDISKNEIGITYTEKQTQAIKQALEENIVIITGGPGTGKSTIIRGIIDTYIRLFNNDTVKEEIALLAPTGRAAKRLKEVTLHSASTIHKFLGFEGHGRYRFGPYNKVSARLVIVDEVSMVDLPLCARLLSSLPEGTKVVLVGDVDQLPSVGPGEVLLNLIETKEITTIRLDKIHRQASDSTIISFAHSINNGYLPDTILEKQHDRNFIRIDEANIIENICKVVEQGIKKGMDLVKDIQVLIPMYRGEIGINNVNEKLQEKFNPLVDYELKHLTRRFRVNDKVIQLVNRSEKNVMNGDIGYIISLDYNQESVDGLTVLFDSGPVYYKKEELEDISHAYAISIHKAQGSEFDLAIIPFSFKYYIMLRRKLIYTAATRAKKYLVMLGDISALDRGIQGVEVRRKTKLTSRIKMFINGSKSGENIFSFSIDEEVFDKTDVNDLENVSPYDFLS